MKTYNGRLQLINCNFILSKVIKLYEPSETPRRTKIIIGGKNDILQVYQTNREEVAGKDLAS